MDRLTPFLFEDVGSPLNGGAKVCQRQLVNEVLGPFVSQFALNLAHEGATPIQRGFDRGLLDRVSAIELIRHRAFRHLGAERTKSLGFTQSRACGFQKMQVVVQKKQDQIVLELCQP